MTSSDHYQPPNWQGIVCEEMLTRFENLGFFVLEPFDVQFAKNLLTETQHLSLKPAKLTHGERIDDVRGDSTFWLNNQLPWGRLYLQAIDELGKFLNRCFFAGIRRSEAHYACYPPNAGYNWHKDNPKDRNERIVSAVFYLNDDWQTDDGGRLELVDKLGMHHTLDPVLGRLVVFDSNLLHRVQRAQRHRYSIATWLRRDD